MLSIPLLFSQVACGNIQHRLTLLNEWKYGWLRWEPTSLNCLYSAIMTWAETYVWGGFNIAKGRKPF